MKEQVKHIFLKMHMERIGQEQFVAGINRDYTCSQKKILICYLDYLRTMRELMQNFWHTTRQVMVQMIRVCIENDWCVDVCGCNDRNAREQIRVDYYDYILGFGENFCYG